MMMFRRLVLLVLILLCCAGVSFAQEDAAVVNDVRTTVDFDYLQQLNPECLGWLYQPESGINQPIMQNKDSKWYYERGFDGVKVYKTGSAYILWQESLNDPVVIVRGQARTEGALAPVGDWKDPAVAAQRPAFRMLTPGGDLEGRVFACIEVEQRDIDKWDPSKTEEAFDEWLARVREKTLLPVDEALLPDENDRLLFVAGLHTNGKCTLVMTKLAPVEYTAQETVDLTKMELDAAETKSRYVQVAPVGEMIYYAQNDLLFAYMRYESAYRDGSYRDFGAGGCGPAAMAMVVANLVDAEELPLIGQYAKNELGNLFCRCSVNRLYCDHTHVPYRLQTPEEYLRYLPAAMADFAAGNNQWEYVGRRPKAAGTNIHFADYVAEVYGLQAVMSPTLEEALTLVKENPGEGLVLLSALHGSPLTNSSHFVVLAGVDEEYFYILDPKCRVEQEYKATDTRHVLELVSPGVVRIRLEDYGRSDLSPYAYYTK